MSDRTWTEPGLTIAERANLAAKKAVTITGELRLQRVFGLILGAMKAAVDDVNPTWTPVSEGLPEESLECWLVVDGKVHEGAYMDFFREFTVDGNSVNPTHWAPLSYPTPPEVL